jgi:amino acid adenylation domain-containing protein
VSDLNARIANLPLEKRKLLEQLLDVGGAASPRQVIARRETSSPAPLSFAQQRLWFLAQFEPGSAIYNTKQAVRLTGTLDADVLRRSLNEIVRRHASLRTTFVESDGQLGQVISPLLDVPLTTVELTETPATERESEAQRLIAEEAQRPFDLARGPVLRTRLLRLSPREHILVLTTHHISADDWSFGIFVRELATLYEAFSTGQPSPLAELPIQYTDFAYWQREHLRGELLAGKLTYWKRQLASPLPVLQLPSDRPRPAIRSYRGATLAFTLPQALVHSLKLLSRREGVTLFMTLLAAFQALLARYTGQADICVGMPIANRNRVEFESLIGLFLNTLVLRTNLEGDPSFSELLRRVREVTLLAYEHQDLPFEKLLEELQPERDLSHTPLFQVLFALQNAPKPSLNIPGLSLKWSSLGVESGASKIDLALLMEETPDGLAGLFEYNTDLFDEATLKRMSVHLQTLLEDAAARPESRLSALQLLPEAERRWLLGDLNNTQAAYPADSCLHELFEAQVARSPDAVALVFETQRLTYDELNGRANKLARYLQALGVGPESVVGVCVERSAEMIVALLGVLKAGGAYLPLDPASPAERLDFMLEDARAAVVLTQQRLADSLPARAARVVCLDTDWAQIAEHSDARVAAGASPDNLAYAIYTSGSTGQPKGVMIAHRGVCNTLRWRQKQFLLNAADRVLQTIPFSFDPSVWQILGTLVSGAQLVLARPGGQQDVAYLLRIMTEQGITVADFAPSMLQALLGERTRESCRQLRHVFCGGEVMPVALRTQFHHSLSANLHNIYGPTEASIDTTCHTCQREDTGSTVAIGRPIANAQVYLLDPHLRPVPLGVPGELYIGGVGLARGYLNQPALTAERFIPHPFGTTPGARLYQTGDIARYSPDGNIEYLYRVDQQVKVRGFRIELGEVEAALKSHASVREVVVSALEDGVRGRRLVAYVVAGRDWPSAAHELRNHLKDKLPAYMTPTAFVLLDALPLMSNGKVDRLALPAPTQPPEAASAALQPPRTQMERTIAALWQEALQVSLVSVHDNFFDLGGHSLLLSQIHARLQKLFGKEIAIADMFQHPTVSSLAQFLGAGQSEQPAFQTSYDRADARRGAGRRLRQIRSRV